MSKTCKCNAEDISCKCKEGCKLKYRKRPFAHICERDLKCLSIGGG